MEPLAQLLSSHMTEERPIPKTPDMQADVHAICTTWGIPPPELADTESASSTPLSEDDLAALSAFISSFKDWGDTGDFAVLAPLNEEMCLAGDTVGPPTPEVSSFRPEIHVPWYTSALHQDHLVHQDVGAWEAIATPAGVPHDSTPESQPAGSSSSCASPPLHRVTQFHRRSLDALLPGPPIAPSKRRFSMDSHIVPNNQPYPSPAMHSFHQRHFIAQGQQHSYSPSHRHHGVVSPGAGSRTVLYQSAQIGGIPRERKESPLDILRRQLTPLAQLSRVRSGRMAPVPLKEWRPKRAPKLCEPLGTIEFWTKEISTGERISGTFLADRFGEDTGRCFLHENELPFPAKKEKGFNLRILWPGYPEFSKKISVHRPLSECTIRDVRDWVFNALSDFIRTPSARQVLKPDFWRVGDDEDAVHVEDLVLIRLRQVGKGTWVPQLNLWDWERTA